MKLNGTILFYRPEPGVFPEIPMLCALKKIRCRIVEPGQEDLSVGELAGITEPSAPAGVRSPAAVPAAMTQPMLVFCGLSNRMLDSFLSDMKARKVRIPIKAVLTEHNVSWTMRALYGELRGEHAALTGENL